MTPPSSSYEQVDGRGKPKVLLDKIAERFGEVAYCIKFEDEEGELGKLINYSRNKTVKITFSSSINPRGIDIDAVIDDLNEFRKLLNDLKFAGKTTDKGNEQRSEDFKAHIKDYQLNANRAKISASAATATAKDPDYAGSAQSHLIELGGLLRLVQSDIIKLKTYKGVIVNWSNLVGTSP